MSGWTLADVPDQRGRTVLVTGAGRGVGRETALALAERGASLLLADADLDALGDVVRRADALAPVRPVAVPLDLADRDSVADAAAHVRGAAPDGLQQVVLHHDGPDAAASTDATGGPLAVRVLGPFGLLVRLHDLLRRVVVVVPPTHRLARDLSDVLGDDSVQDDSDQDDAASGEGPGWRERVLRRTGWGGGAEAALASLLLGLELDSRARAAGRPLRATVAVAGLDVSDAVDKVAERTTSLRERGPSILDAALGAVGQRADVAHHPVLMAATSDLPGSSVVGLGGALGLGTSTRIVNPPRPARDKALRARVWELAVDHAGQDPWARA